ncbi:MULTISPECIES: preprotein translocase subunit SecG [Rhodanobacter]|uniref:Protein-export membrane protein SecG n=2 Tax=Rhodanobacter TaxID=75309 RepID=I4VX18_9GAMM|nr:preprotein translocase subunit SecG [Rhodanobacter spathiphylli]EIL91759.1 preprotein translocase subunit SecG [Rhodanobacter spathiphylli B39]
MFVIFSVFYILIAAAMIVLILLQNGAGADAGSGFGGGASATVFGARGSSTFLTRATSVLAALFFLLSLAMGVYLNDNGAPKAKAQDLGVMSSLSEKPAATNAAPAKPAAGSEIPAAVPASTNNAVPAAQPAATPAPTQSQGEVPAATEPPVKH